MQKTIYLISSKHVSRLETKMVLWTNKVMPRLDIHHVFSRRLGAPGSKAAAGVHDEGAQRDDKDVVELGTVTCPIPRGRQIPSACRRTEPAILVAAFRDSIQENLDLPLGL
jgi:hypothetical protein